jgi:hypothetical protein
VLSPGIDTHFLKVFQVFGYLFVMFHPVISEIRKPGTGKFIAIGTPYPARLKFLTHAYPAISTPQV